MDILITTTSDLPIYKQIEETIITEILNGKIVQNTMLPSIRQLACELNVSVITVKKAYENLQQNGFVYSFPGKGFYVNEMSEEQIRIIKKKITENTMIKQIDHLKSLGIDSNEILAIIKDRINEH